MRWLPRPTEGVADVSFNPRPPISTRVATLVLISFKHSRILSRFSSGEFVSDAGGDKLWDADTNGAVGSDLLVSMELRMPSSSEHIWRLVQGVMASKISMHWDSFSDDVDSEDS